MVKKITLVLEGFFLYLFSAEVFCNSVTEVIFFNESNFSYVQFSEQSQVKLVVLDQRIFINK